jgi:hypothetical protein
LLRQARLNLTGNAKDFWTMGIRSVRQQSTDLQNLATRVSDNAQLVADANRARAATCCASRTAPRTASTTCRSKASIAR